MALNEPPETSSTKLVHTREIQQNHLIRKLLQNNFCQKSNTIL